MNYRQERQAEIKRDKDRRDRMRLEVSKTGETARQRKCQRNKRHADTAENKDKRQPEIKGVKERKGSQAYEERKTRNTGR